METELTEEAPPDAPDRSLVRLPLLVAAVAMVVQVLLTDYGSAGTGARVFWLVVWLWLLWMVWQRRSGVARLLVGASAAIGTVIYVVDAAMGDLSSVGVALAYAVQTAALLLPVVHRHVKVVKAVG